VRIVVLCSSHIGSRLAPELSRDDEVAAFDVDPRGWK
jgi:hypothetical protein